MRRTRQPGLVALTLSTACLFLSLGQGCAGSPPPNRLVCGTCEDPQRFVRLQRRAAEIPGTQSRLAHPFRLDLEDWKPILESIRVRNRAQRFLFFSVQGPEALAFTPDEVGYLSTTLSRAFAQAQPEDWVVFGLGRPGPPGVTEMTTGAWYVEGTTLHLVLANYRAAVTMGTIREALERDPLYEIVGSTLYEFAPGESSQPVTGSHSFLRTLSPDAPHLAIAYATLLAGTRPDGQDQGKPGVTVKPKGEPPGATPEASIEERLEILKRLRERGLITEEDFQAKKKQLLERF